ncbi:MAG: hypothetical protein JWP25_2132 [Bradyrhizobium sp.]|jgi:hypothetical protein|nr:hypothetical protein [Bradyrhizobium sp.]
MWHDVQFDAKHPELRVKLMLAGNIAKCGVSDNVRHLNPSGAVEGLRSTASWPAVWAAAFIRLAPPKDLPSFSPFR